jgi:hypothetical protein
MSMVRQMAGAEEAPSPLGQWQAPAMPWEQAPQWPNWQPTQLPNVPVWMPWVSAPKMPGAESFNPAEKLMI